jgi:mannose-6-phosphate isomerase-like protein (cupin superfamily)
VSVKRAGRALLRIEEMGGMMNKVTEESIANSTSTFDLLALAGKFPPTADTMLLDIRMTDEPAASSRLFRIYQPAPAHFHKTCDEYLQVITGRGKFVVDGGEPMELGPGQLLFFRRNVVHSIPEVIEGPLVVFSVDTPRRDPADVHFVNPADGTAATFIRTIKP